MCKIFKKTIGIFFLIEFIVSLYLAFTDLREYPFVALFTSSFFGVVAFLLLRHPKQSEVNTITLQPDDKIFNSEIETLEAASENHSISYIENENIIYKTDNSKISDEEVLYLRKISQEKATAQWKTPQLVRLINESYQIMFSTDNPETLCDRYKFSIKNYQELLFYENQGYFKDKDTIDNLHEKLSVENYSKLIYQCYQKYVSKAQKELKTQRGVNNRINKFWKTIQDNVDTNTYIALRKHYK